MKHIKFTVALAVLFGMARASAQEVVELPLPDANKIIVRLMFRNGSVTDPQGMEGLT